MAVRPARAPRMGNGSQIPAHTSAPAATSKPAASQILAAPA